MDYAVVVEMARNMASGTDFPVFFYGQAYMGSLEPAVSALICLMFGPSPFCVCLGTAILGIATLFVTMHVGKRLAGECGGILSQTLATTGGYHWIHFMASPRGGYALAALLVVSSISMASIVNFQDAGSGKVRISSSALFGFMAGLAFWNFWIALPAFAAAGVVLLIRLRLRVFSRRFLLPFLTAFFTGSLPWWIWTARNGFNALDMDGNGPVPLGWTALKTLFSTVIPAFFDTASSPSIFWHSMLPWTLAALLLVSVAAILTGKDKAQKAFLFTTFAYTALFAVAYAKSSFGSMGVARYLVPFVPVFSILCGSALGSLPSRVPADGQRRRKVIPIAVVVVVFGFYALGGARPAVRSSIVHLKSLREMGMQWKKNVDTVADDSSLAQAAFADFSLFGFNWASNRRICLVSPARWRYAPYLEHLEEADHPAVINDYCSFRTFCKASGGTCRNRSVGKTGVSDEVAPPPETEEASFTETPLVKTEAGLNVAEMLFDDNCATGVQLLPSPPSKPYLDVYFSSTSMVTGVSILMDPYQSAIGWQVDFIGADGGITPGVSEIPHKGWYWSGPRQYQFGPESRWTIRWPTGIMASGIRISFAVNRPDLPVFISDMRLLSDRPLPSPDVDALKGAVSTARWHDPDLRIYAGRWLGRRIGAPPDPAMRFGQSSGNLGVPEVCNYVTIDHSRPSLLVFHDPNIADAAANTLQSLNLDFGKTEAGACVLIAVPRSEAIKAANVPLRLVGGRLMRDEPPALDIAHYEPKGIDFGDTISLSGVGPLPKSIHPGDTVYLDMIWQFSQKRCGNTPIYVFVHGIQNGKIAFQGIASLKPFTERRPADRPHPTQLTLKMEVPKDIPAGEITFAACIKRATPFARRIKPTGKDLSVTSRRVILEHATVGDWQTEF